MHSRKPLRTRGSLLGNSFLTPVGLAARLKLRLRLSFIGVNQRFIAARGRPLVLCDLCLLLRFRLRPSMSPAQDTMDKIGSVLSHQPSISIEDFRAAQLSGWTKPPSFASRIDFLEIVTKLPSPTLGFLLLNRLLLSARSATSVV